MTELHLGENDLQVRNEIYFKLSPDVFSLFSISNLVAFLCGNFYYNTNVRSWFKVVRADVVCTV